MVVLVVPVVLFKEKVGEGGEGWRKFEMVGEGRRRFGERPRRSEKVGESSTHFEKSCSHSTSRGVTSDKSVVLFKENSILLLPESLESSEWQLLKVNVSKKVRKSWKP